MNISELKGFVPIGEEKETENHIISQFSILIDGRALNIECLKSKSFKGAEFLPAKVTDEAGKTLWLFKDEGFKGLAKFYRIFMPKNEHLDVIGLSKICKDTGGTFEMLYKVVPLTDLGKTELILVGDESLRIGGHDIEQLAELKDRLGRQVKMRVNLTATEKKILGIIQEDKEKLAAEEKAEKEEQRRARRQEILNRRTITVFTTDGRRLYGIPVKDDEWYTLPDNTGAVLVDNDGNPVEAFFVRKGKNGRAEKVAVKTDLTLTKPEEKMKTGEMKVFRIDGQVKPVLVVDESTMKEMAKKLNSGTLVATPWHEEANKFKVFTLRKGEAKKLGVYEAI